LNDLPAEVAGAKRTHQFYRMALGRASRRVAACSRRIAASQPVYRRGRERRGLGGRARPLVYAFQQPFNPAHRLPVRLVRLDVTAEHPQRPCQQHQALEVLLADLAGPAEEDTRPRAKGGDDLVRAEAGLAPRPMILPVEWSQHSRYVCRGEPAGATAEPTWKDLAYGPAHVARGASFQTSSTHFQPSGSFRQTVALLPGTVTSSPTASR